MTFARPGLLPLLVLLPALLAAGIWIHARRRRRVAAAFSDAHLLERLGGGDLLRFPTARLALVSLAGLCLAMAAAGPQWGVREVEGRSHSLNVVLATDISRSMLAEDIEPNRLERARLFTRRLLRELPGDRFGMVAFAGRAYVLTPLTVDHSALDLYVDALDPNMVSQGGSSLAAALAQATDLARGSQPEAGDRVVVLLSDGEALEEEDAVYAAADRAARAGIRVMTVGFGTPMGSNIPVVDPATGEVSGLTRDQFGEVVVTRLDEPMMREIASRTGGIYVRADDAGSLPRLVAQLRGMQRAAGDGASRLEPRDRFAIFALLAVLLLALDTLLAAPRRAAAAAAVATSPRKRSPVVAGARTAAVVVLTLVATGFGIGDLERGNRHYRAGEYAEAVQAYQRVLEGGRASPQVHYNMGTALLALGRYTKAEQHLRNALQDVDPEIRHRAFYNMGNRFLEEARADTEPERQGRLLDAAIEAYRRTLRLEPSDPAAKWNLELALRERDENQQQQDTPQQPEQQDGDDDDQESDGGTGGGAAPAGGGDGRDREMGADQQPMTPQQAEQILNALEQDERDVARQRLRRGQQPTPVLRDW